MTRFACLLLVLTSCVGVGNDLANGPTPEDTCEGPLGPPIPLSGITAMTACCQDVNGQAGQAHCLESSKVPSELQPFVASCETGGYCIPDAFLATGAAEPPKTCTAFGGMGVCLSRCIPSVAENEGLLRPETCEGADELCVPCISPLDNMPTGACDLLELAQCVGADPVVPDPVNACDDPATCNYDEGCAPVVDPSILTACGDGAHCVPPALVTDPEQAAQLGMCEDGSSYCVPDTFIETGGKFTADSCTSVAGAEGRCLSLVLPAVADQASLLPQATCEASERCTPCFDPLTGQPTGACTLSCDTGPTQPAVTFAQCCDNRARCVPASAIPDEQEGQLSDEDCEAEPDSLCVPNEILADGPFPACAASGPLIGSYTGVCLSDCLDFGFVGLALGRGNCQQGYKCAPCEQFGDPTGAPGCPTTP